MTRRSGVVVREKAGALTCTFSIFLFMLSFSPITNSEFERKNPIFENDFETWILIFWAVNVGEITVIYDSLETCRTQVVKYWAGRQSLKQSKGRQFQSILISKSVAAQTHTR